MKKKALIIQLKFLGDVLIATNIADNLKKCDREYEVHFLCFSNALPLVENHPMIDKVWHIGSAESKKLGKILALMYELRQEQFHLILDPYSKLQSMLITVFSSASLRVSFDEGWLRKLVYNRRFKLSKGMPYLSSSRAMDDRINFVRRLYPNCSNWIESYKLYVDPKNTDLSTMELYGFNEPFMVIGVLGSSINKSYRSEYMVNLIDKIRGIYSGAIVFNYAPSQKKEAFAIYNNLSNKESVYPELMGRDLREFLILFRHAQLCVSNEGGLIHMSKGLGIPSFSIFSENEKVLDWATMEELGIHEHVHIEEYISKETIQDAKKDFMPSFFEEKLLKFILKYSK